MPSWIRSSRHSSLSPWYLRAIETTRRRLWVVSLSLAARSPASMRLASSSSSSGRSSWWRPASLRNCWSASVVKTASSVLVIATPPVDASPSTGDRAQSSVMS